MYLSEDNPSSLVWTLRKHDREPSDCSHLNHYVKYLNGTDIRSMSARAQFELEGQSEL